jgi:hypothetical protein
VRFMPDLNECVLDHIICDVALAYDTVSRSQQPGRFLSIIFSKCSFVFCARQQDRFEILLRPCGGRRKVMAPAHASARFHYD